MVRPAETFLLTTAPNLITLAVAAGSIAGAATTLFQDYMRSKKVRKNEITDLSSVIVTETTYIKQRREVPKKVGVSFSQDELNRIYYTQIIRNFDSIDLSQAYAQSHYKNIAKDIKAAMMRCTAENPVVLSHVDLAIAAKENDTQKRQSHKNAFTDPLLNYCSKIFNPNTESYVLQDDASRKRSHANEVWLIPILFYEPNAIKKQLRLELKTEADLLSIADMDPARIHCEKDTEGLRQAHIHFDRFRTLQTIARLYVDPTRNVRDVLNACAFKTQPYDAPNRLQQLRRPSVARTSYITALSI